MCMKNRQGPLRVGKNSRHSPAKQLLRENNSNPGVLQALINDCSESRRRAGIPIPVKRFSNLLFHLKCQKGQFAIALHLKSGRVAGLESVESGT